MNKKFEHLDDEELFYLLKKKGEVAEKAFAELYQRHSPRVFAYCRRFLGNREEAQDVFQETFIRFFNSAKNDREMTNIPGFLLRIARNLCVNTKRRTKNHLQFEDYMAGESGHRHEKDELLNLIKMAIDLLPDDYKDVFILREYDGLSYADIAEIIDEPMTTVKIRIHRAKQKIREILAPYLADLSDNEK